MLAVILIVAVIVIIALVFMAMYNGLVKLRNRVDSAWSQISVQLQRRHDLIPNLVETVKGYASHERQTLEAVTAARNAAVQAQEGGHPAAQAEAENMLTGTLRQLFALSEAYPDLKANQNFLNLQEEITSTEDKIAYSRQFYNDSVLGYNNRIQSFPANALAGMFHFTPREYFEGDPGEQGPVAVQF